jgi:hypothetical protein
MIPKEKLIFRIAEQRNEIKKLNNLRWFWLNYLRKDIAYGYFILQLGGFKPMSELVRMAVVRFIRTGN